MFLEEFLVVLLGHFVVVLMEPGLMIFLSGQYILFRTAQGLRDILVECGRNTNHLSVCGPTLCPLLSSETRLQSKVRDIGVQFCGEERSRTPSGISAWDPVIHQNSDVPWT